MDDLGKSVHKLVSDPDGQKYDPGGAQAVGCLALVVYILLIPLAFWILSGLFKAVFENGSYLILIIPISISVLLIRSLFNAEKRHNTIKREGRISEQNRIKVQETRDRENIQRMQRTLDEMGEVMASLENESIRTGDIIVKGHGSTVVIGSHSVSVIHKQGEESELGKALTAVLGYIESTNNKEAAEYFDALALEIEKDGNNPTLLKSLWSSIISSAPGVKQLSEAVATISKLF